MKKNGTREKAGGSTAQVQIGPGSAIDDARPAATALQQQAKMMSASSSNVSLSSLQSHMVAPVQRAPNEEFVQGKFTFVPREKNKKLLQGQFDGRPAIQVIQRMVSSDLTNGATVKVIEPDRQDVGKIGTIVGHAVRIDGYFVQFKAGHTRDFLYMELELVDSGVKAEKEGAIDPRVRPAIDLERSRYEHKSNVPKMDTDMQEILDQWGGLNNPQFYAALRASLKIARDPEHPDHDSKKLKLDKLINSYDQHPKVKALIDKYVRVKAIKAKGASSGTGLDELFKTSETMKYVERSYRPSKEMAAVALFNGEEFDWMDAQQQMRLSTEFIVWAYDLVGEIAGHTGTFQREFAGKWMTKRQALMHELRDDAISSRSNPATAVIEAIGMHLRVTENVAGFKQQVYKDEKAEKTILSSGYSVAESYDFLVIELGKHRDALKRYEISFRKQAKTAGESSPMRPRLGGSDYYPSSPMQGPEDDSMMNEEANIAGNPLPSLATQSRLGYTDQAKKIPKAPINPAIAFAYEKLKVLVGTPAATKIKLAAKRKAKPLLADEDSSSDMADKVMVEVYLDRVDALDPSAQRQEILDELQRGLVALLELTQ